MTSVFFENRIKWLQQDSNPQPVSCKKTVNHKATMTMIELCCEYLYVRCTWLNVLIMPRTRLGTKCLGACLQAKWLWVRLLLQSNKLQILCLFRARSSLTFRQSSLTCTFTLKCIGDMTTTYSHGNYYWFSWK